jgi:hypothetical protein
MSGIKPADLQWFYRSIHNRTVDVAGVPTRLNVSVLARVLNVGRSHLAQVLAGTRTGTVTWRKVERSGLLTPEELRLLGRDVPRGTNSHMEQLSKEVA